MSTYEVGHMHDPNDDDVGFDDESQAIMFAYRLADDDWKDVICVWEHQEPKHIFTAGEQFTRA